MNDLIKDITPSELQQISTRITDSRDTVATIDVGQLHRTGRSLRSPQTAPIAYSAA